MSLPINNIVFFNIFKFYVFSEKLNLILCISRTEFIIKMQKYLYKRRTVNSFERFTTPFISYIFKRGYFSKRIFSLYVIGLTLSFFSQPFANFKNFELFSITLILEPKVISLFYSVRKFKNFCL